MFTKKKILTAIMIVAAIILIAVCATVANFDSNAYAVDEILGHVGHSGWQTISANGGSTLSIHGPINGDAERYYLTSDISGTELEISGKVAICLDGHSLTNEGVAIRVKSGAEFTLCDGQKRGSVIGTGTNGTGILYENNASGTSMSVSVSIYDVNVRGTAYGIYNNNGNMKVCGGGIGSDSCALFNAEGDVTLEDVTMTSKESGIETLGGTVHANSGRLTVAGIADACGINVGGDATLYYSTSASEFETKLTSIGSTGIYNSGSLIMQGGSVEASLYGVHNTATGGFTMKAGSVEAKSATGGTGIMADSASVGIVTISNGTVIGAYRGIYNKNTTLTVTGGQIQGKTRDENGGMDGIYFVSGEINISEATAETAITADGTDSVGIRFANNAAAEEVNIAGTLALANSPTVSGTLADIGLVTVSSTRDAASIIFSYNSTPYDGEVLAVSSDSVFVDGYIAKGVSEENSDKINLLSDAYVARLSDNGGLTVARAHKHADISFDQTISAGSTELTTGNYYLDGDVQLSFKLLIVTGATVNLCLNGHMLTGKEGDAVIQISTGATFTLYDTPGDKTHAYTVDDNGLWSFVDVDEDDETESENFVCGGVITGGSAGVYLDSNSVFNMRGGTIAGNNASTGGGVYIAGDSSTVRGGTFNMYDGAIVGNRATYGGGVYLNGLSNESKKRVNIYGGNISNNTAACGGGIYIGSYAELIVNGENKEIELSYNRAINLGGGIYIDDIFENTTKAVFYDVEITNNSADMLGGGVYINGTDIEIGGLVTITDNFSVVTDALGEVSDIADNVYINSDNNSIRVTKPLDEESRIGVTIGNDRGGMGIATSGYTELNPDSDPQVLFSADSERLYIGTNDSGEIIVTDKLFYAVIYRYFLKENGLYDIDRHIVEAGSHVTIKTFSEGDDYLVDGWYLDEADFNDESKAVTDIPSLEGNVVLYAKNCRLRYDIVQWFAYADTVVDDDTLAIMDVNGYIPGGFYSKGAAMYNVSGYAAYGDRIHAQVGSELGVFSAPQLAGFVNPPKMTEEDHYFTVTEAGQQVNFYINRRVITFKINLGEGIDRVEILPTGQAHYFESVKPLDVNAASNAGTYTAGFRSAMSFIPYCNGEVVNFELDYDSTVGLGLGWTLDNSTGRYNFTVPGVDGYEITLCRVGGYGYIVNRYYQSVGGEYASEPDEVEENPKNWKDRIGYSSVATDVEHFSVDATRTTVPSGSGEDKYYVIQTNLGQGMSIDVYYKRNVYTLTVGLDEHAESITASGEGVSAYISNIYNVVYGATVTLECTYPTVVGTPDYVFDCIDVTMGSDSLSLANGGSFVLEGDAEAMTRSKGSETHFHVIYCVENINDDGYSSFTEVQIDELDGERITVGRTYDVPSILDAVGEDLLVELGLPSSELILVEPKTFAVTKVCVNDSHSEVRMYYDRKAYTFTVNADAGIRSVTAIAKNEHNMDNDSGTALPSAGADGTYTVKFGTTVQIGIDVKTGYTVKEYDIQSDEEINVNLTARTFVQAGADVEMTVTTEPIQVEVTVKRWESKLGAGATHNGDNYTVANTRRIEAYPTYTGTNPKLMPAAIVGFTLEEGDYVTNGDGSITFEDVTIAGDGSTVIDLYYRRNVYTATVEYNDVMVTEIELEGTGVSVSGSGFDVEYGARAQINVTLVSGYMLESVFIEYGSESYSAGDESGYVYTHNYTCDINVKVHTAVITGVEYKIRRWIQKIGATSNSVDGYTNYVRYSLTEATRYGTANEAPSYTPGVIEGFTYFWHDDTVTVNPDGSTIIDVFYTRNIYGITVIYGPNTGSVALSADTGLFVSEGSSGTASGNTEITGRYSAHYGATVVVTATPKYGHEVTRAWLNDEDIASGSFTMPARESSLEVYSSPSRMSYTVRHFRQQLDGDYPTDPDATSNGEGTYGDALSVTGMTGTYSGFAVDYEQSGLTDGQEYIALASNGQVIDYYYARVYYTLTLSHGVNTQSFVASVATLGAGDVEPFERDENDNTHYSYYKVMYGTRVSLLATPKTGYEFDRSAFSSTFTLSEIEQGFYNQAITEYTHDRAVNATVSVAAVAKQTFYLVYSYYQKLKAQSAACASNADISANYESVGEPVRHEAFTGLSVVVTPNAVTGYTTPSNKEIIVGYAEEGDNNNATKVYFFYERSTYEFYIDSDNSQNVKINYTLSSFDGTSIKKNDAYSGTGRGYIVRHGATVAVSTQNMARGYMLVVADSANPTPTFTTNSDQTNYTYTFIQGEEGVHSVVFSSEALEVQYTVRYWLQIVGAGSAQNSTNFTLNSTEKAYMYTGTLHTHRPTLNLDGFTTPASYRQTISGDGLTTWDYYYVRKVYALTVTADRHVRANVTGVGKTDVSFDDNSFIGVYRVQYGAQIEISTVLDSGYYGELQIGSEGTQSHTASGYVQGAGDVKVNVYSHAYPAYYSIKHMYEKLDGTYEEDTALTVPNIESTTGALISITDADYHDKPNYTAVRFTQHIYVEYNSSPENYQIVEFRYRLDRYDLTVTDNGHVIVEVSGTGVTEQGDGVYAIKYGATVSVLITPDEGYEVVSTTGVELVNNTFVQGAENATLDIKSGAIQVGYTVEYYFQGLNMSTLVYEKDESMTESLSTTYDTTVDITPGAVDGFTAKPVDSVKVNAIGLLIKVYYTRSEYRLTLVPVNHAEIIVHEDRENGVSKNSDGRTYTVRFGATVVATVSVDEGYTISGIEGATANEAGFEYVQGIGDVTVTVNTVLQSLVYVTENYYQSITGDENEYSQYVLDGTSSATLSYTEVFMPTFDAKVGFTVKTLEIATSGSTRLYKIYYVRKTTRVNLVKSGQVTASLSGEGVTDNGDGTYNVRYGSTVTVNATAGEGFFVSGYEGVSLDENRSYLHDATGAEMTVKVIASAFSVGYRVEYYFQTLACGAENYGEYVKGTHNESKDGYAYGDKVTVTPETVEGFTLARPVGETELNEAETLIKVYYKRNVYRVSVRGDEHVSITLVGDGVSGNAAIGYSVLYGAEVTVEASAAQGYSVKEIDGVTLNGNTFTQGASDADIIASSEVQVINYTVEYYFQTLTCDSSAYGEFEKNEALTAEKNADYGTVITTDGEDKTGFTLVNTDSVTITDDTVIKLYYVRNVYTVTVSAVEHGEITLEGDGVSGDGPYSVRYGAIVTVSAETDEGYVVKTYNGAEVENGVFTLGASDITLTAVVARAEVNYTVEHYFQGLTGADDDLNAYVKDSGLTENKQTVYGQAVNIAAKEIEGFDVREYESEVTVTKDGMVIKLYYTRKSYTVRIGEIEHATVALKGEGVTGNAADGYVVRFGAQISVEVKTEAGYQVSDISGADIVGDVFLQGASNVTLDIATVKSEKKITVEYYLQPIDCEDSDYTAYEKDDTYTKVSVVSYGEGASTEYAAIEGFSMRMSEELADGSDVTVKVYYSRNSYVLTVVAADGVGVEIEGDGVEKIGAGYSVRYGATVTAKVSGKGATPVELISGTDSRELTVSNGACSFKQGEKDSVIRIGEAKKAGSGSPAWLIALCAVLGVALIAVVIVLILKCRK